LIFYIRDEFEYELGVGTYILVTRVLKLGKSQTHTQTQSKRGKPAYMTCVVMPTSYLLFFLTKINDTHSFKLTEYIDTIQIQIR